MDLLTHELKLLSTTADSTSERVLVMSRVLLQRDPLIKASKDIRTLIGRRIEEWKENKIDNWLAEAVRCAQILWPRCSRFLFNTYNTSREAVTVLYDAIADQHGFSHEDHRKQMSRSRK